MNAPAQRSPMPGSPPPGAQTLGDDPRPWLSALVDGDVAAVQQACDAWRLDAQARADWHTYHLIGDVLRSDELAGRPAHDAQFLARLRQRLADEPVLLVPEPAADPAEPYRRRSAWLVPVAAAAGVATVAAVLVLVQADPRSGGELGAPAASLALNGPAREAPNLLARQAAGDRVANAGVPTGNANARVLRDARLDQYLDAHRGALGATVAVPGGAMRNAEVIVPVPEAR